MKLRLSIKLGLGFAALLAITGTLGGFAALRMRGVVTLSTQLAGENVPEVNLAARLTDGIDTTMLNARSYSLSGQQSYRDLTEKNFGELEAAIADATKFSQQHPGLDTLRKQLADLAPAEQEYRKLFDQTVEFRTRQEKDIADMNGTVASVISTMNELSDSQSKRLAEEIKAATTKDAGVPASQPSIDLAARARMSSLASGLEADMTKIRVAVWKSLANSDVKAMHDAGGGFKQIHDAVDSLRPMLTAPRDMEDLEKIMSGAQTYEKGINDLADAMQKVADLGPRRLAVADKVGGDIDEINKSGLADVTSVTDQTNTSLASAMTGIYIGLAIAVVVGIALAIVITRSITGPVNRIISSLSAGAIQTSSAAQQVSGSSQSLAQGASEQAASLEETSSSLEEMSSMTKKNADTARQASLLSGEAKTSADRGNEAMVKMTQAIDSIQKASTETAKIVKTIDEIAFQTNLLALNAAVEAARAGESGKGFAVVAEEVRNLAMRSAEAAKTTSSLIEGSVVSSKNGVTIAQDVARTLGEIQGAVEKVNGLIAEIAAAGQEQSQGIGQINQAIQQLDKVTQSNAASSEESAAAAEELSSQSEQLRSLVGDLTLIVSGHAAGHHDAPAHPARAHKARPAPAANQAAEKKAPPAPAAEEADDFADFSLTR